MATKSGVGKMAIKKEKEKRKEKKKRITTLFVVTVVVVESSGRRERKEKSWLEVVGDAFYCPPASHRLPMKRKE